MIIIKIILVSVFYFFSFLTWAQELNSSDPQLVYKQHEIDKGFKNNRAWGVEAAYNLVVLKPQVFIEKTINQRNIVLNGPTLALTKGFVLSDSLFTTSNLRASVFKGSGKISEYDISRNTEVTTAQFVQQLGLNLFSWKVDSATLHPHLGVGGYWVDLKDTYSGSGYNRISDRGFLAEIGLTLMDQLDGVYLTTRVTGQFSNSNKLDSGRLLNPLVGLDTSKTVSFSQNLNYSLGFGFKF